MPATPPKKYRNATITWERTEDGLEAPKVEWTRNTTDYQQIIKINVKRRIIILSIVLVIILSSLYGLTRMTTGRQPELSAYEDHWNDASSFKNGVQSRGYKTASVIMSPMFLSDMKGDVSKKVLVIIGVQEKYTPEEEKAIYNFVDAGGCLILASESTKANSLADYFGVAFTGGRLYDINYLKNPDFVQVPVVPADNFYFSGLITLNQPAALEDESHMSIIASTTEKAWVDRDGDKQISSSDEGYGSYPVAAIVHEGKGTAIMISDPSIFINDMIHITDNFNFTMALVSYLLPEGGTVIFEESQHIKSTTGASLTQSFFLLLFVISKNTIGMVITALLLILATGLVYIWADYPPKISHIHFIGLGTKPDIIYSPISASDWPIVKRTYLTKIAEENDISTNDDSEILDYVKDRHIKKILISDSIPSTGDIRQMVDHLTGQA